eukprot:3483312-Prymnesium_polylepis.2
MPGEPPLYVGNGAHAAEIKLLQRLGIMAVLNAAPSVCKDPAAKFRANGILYAVKLLRDVYGARPRGAVVDGPFNHTTGHRQLRSADELTPAPRLAPRFRCRADIGWRRWMPTTTATFRCSPSAWAPPPRSSQRRTRRGVPRSSTAGQESIARPCWRSRTCCCATSVASSSWLQSASPREPANHNLACNNP